MIINTFHHLLDKELEAIIHEEDLKQHKNLDQNKGRAFLVWFLRFYGQQRLFESFITDGPGDSSCDIILKRKTEREDIFYVVQSKYIQYKEGQDEDSFPKIKSEEFGHALNDFATILSGKRQLGKNEQFNEQYKKLLEHLQNNGKVKFIFFTLAFFNPAIQDSIAAFRKQHGPNIELELIDGERIRRDFIEVRYKQIKSSNPLEQVNDAESSEIVLEVERSEETRRDFFEYRGRSKGFIFLVKPKTIHELFQKYGFGLFYKNVRNPLPQSNYNQNIVETLLSKPDAFWFFNNGITAITKYMPELGQHAQRLTVDGLQIINGAQTVYSMYSAYEQATEQQRRIMDKDARLMMRLINSSDEEFNLQITRYTNSQNPMEDRDFWANDEVQIRLQNESFKTNFWYEKRRGEIPNKEELKEMGVEVFDFRKPSLMAYVFFYQGLQVVGKSFHQVEKYIFISKKNNPSGLYETFFNEDMDFKKVLVSYFLSTLKISYGSYNFVFYMFFHRFLPSVYEKKYKTKQFNLTNYLYDKVRNKDKKIKPEIEEAWEYFLNIIKNENKINPKSLHSLEQFTHFLDHNPVYLQAVENFQFSDNRH